MSSIVIVAGSPSASSRAVALTEFLAARLRVEGHTVRVVRVRELPAEALIGGDASDPRIAEVIGALAESRGVVVVSGVYKASYSGVLKVLLDLLPQSVLAGKAVLPVLIGGSPTHYLALDHGLRPVLTALGARQVTRGLFLLDKQVERVADGIRLAAGTERQVLDAIVDFHAVLPQFGMAAR